MKTITLYNSLGQTQGVMSSNDPDAFKDGHGDLMAIEGSYNSNYYIAVSYTHLTLPTILRV